MLNPELEQFARAISRLFGWTYFFTWSLSFYPQLLMNWQRKSTQGFAIDFPTLNVVGFVSYTVSTGAFLFNPTIREQYAERNPLAPVPTVRANDFVFALHGALCCVVAYSMFWPRLWGFETVNAQRSSGPVLGIVFGCILGVLIVIVLVEVSSNDGGFDARGWAWIEVIYAISYVKVVATFIKYMPQVWMNYRRKSTVGFHIGSFLLDFAGGVLSIGQLLIDSALQDDWTGVTGNPAKLLLANVSIVFDVIFMVQHYHLYRDANKEDEGEREPLIASDV